MELGDKLEYVGPSAIRPKEPCLEVQDDERDCSSERDHMEFKEITGCGRSVADYEDFSTLYRLISLDVYAAVRVETGSARGLRSI